MDNPNIFKGCADLKLGVIIALTALTLFLVGCGTPFFDLNDKAIDKAKEAQERLKKEDEQAGRVDVPDNMVLGEGEVLRVRLNYGTDTVNTPSWYRVRLDNLQNGWYDYVEYSAENGFGGGQYNNYHDYAFYYENFNKQLNEDHYEPASPNGEYTLTISGSNGYFVQKKMEWRGNISHGEWVLGHKVMAYSVP